jgi:uncharacterized membrane protein
MKASVLAIRLGALLGLIAALLAMYVESEAAAASALGVAYVSPLCDRFGFSCSKVLTSRYAHVLSAWGVVPRGHAMDVSNAAAGAAYYALALALSAPASLCLPASAARSALLFASAGSLAFSAYLAWILKTVLKENCPICISMYVANAAIFVGAAARAAAALPRGAGKRD